MELFSPAWFSALASIILIDMLRTLIHGFRVYHNDPQALAADLPGATPAQKQANTDAEMAFVNDVLSDPVLHARDVKLAHQDDPAALARQIDYINEHDLVALVYNIATLPAQAPPAERGPSDSGSNSQDGLPPAPVAFVEAVSAPTRIKEVAARTQSDRNLRLPGDWVGASAAEPRAYATTANFAAYVGRWFSTIEGTAAQRYKQLMRHLTFVLAALTVVLFNIDSLHILAELYGKTAERTALVQQLDDLKRIAARVAPKESGPAADGAAAAVGDDPVNGVFTRGFHETCAQGQIQGARGPIGQVKNGCCQSWLLRGQWRGCHASPRTDGICVERGQKKMVRALAWSGLSFSGLGRSGMGARCLSVGHEGLGH